MGTEDGRESEKDVRRGHSPHLCIDCCHFFAVDLLHSFSLSLSCFLALADSTRLRATYTLSVPLMPTMYFPSFLSPLPSLSRSFSFRTKTSHIRERFIELEVRVALQREKQNEILLHFSI